MKKLFLLMLSVFAFCAADAQVTTSGMNGTVTDADGQPLAGATVIAVHTPSGTQYGAVSDKNGGYNLQGLRTGGPYTVTFSFVGCQSVEFPGLMLSLGQTLKRDAFLKDSQELEAVVITADGKNSSMNVNRAGAVTSISNEQIELMPTVNRSMNDIMRLTPQASSTTSGLAIGGGNYRIGKDITISGGEVNAINLCREAVAPGTRIRFSLTLDQSVLHGQLTAESIVDAIEAFDRYYEETYACGFALPEGAAPGRMNHCLILGGGAGFFSKSLAYPYYGEEQALHEVSAYMHRTFRGHYHQYDEGWGMSPHMMKYTQWNGKMYPYGICEVSVR